ncbi:MAG: hypothetical protein AABM43_04770 [Actinomycetota bacterium]
MASEPTADDLEREEAELLGRYRSNVEAAQAALQEALGQPTVKGSQGQPVSNPSFAVAERCDELAVSLHRELEAVRKRRAEIAEIEAGKISDARLR